MDVDKQRMPVHRPSARKHFARLTDLCSDCGDPIEDSRLKTVSYATRCIECQLFFDNQQKKHSNV